MLIVSEIDKNFDQYVEGLQKRGLTNAETLLKEVLDKDRERKEIQRKLDAALNESKQISKEIGQLFKQGKKNEAEAARAKTGTLKEESKSLSEKQQVIAEELINLLYNIPNIPHASVPSGNTEEDNEIIKVNDAATPELLDGKKPHWELIGDYDIIDFELGNKVAGAGFPFYKGQGARLVRGLINYFLDKAMEAGYVEIQPPIVINEASGFGTGQLPDKEGQMYHMEANNLYMIPTAEVPITNMYRDMILHPDQLPIKNTGHTP